MYTLADNGTNKAGQNHVIVNGEGSDLSKKEALKGRAKCKTITQSVMLKMIDIVKENGEPESKKAYWNTYHCQNNIIIADGRLYGRYCKNRVCTLCCRIRKAEIINRYYPIIKQWRDPYFVTLTIRAIPEKKLKSIFKAFIRGFKRITQKIRKRNQRGNPFKLVGVKSLECNFNPKMKTYNPHLHLIVETEEMAIVLINEWLKLWTPKFALRKAQNMSKIYNVEKSLVEIIKYGSKIFTEPDLNKRAKETHTVEIYAKALDNILTAMKGIRIFDRFGFNAPKENQPKYIHAKLLAVYEELEFNLKISDWVNTTTGELLTKYKIPSHLQATLENNLNTDLA